MSTIIFPHPALYKYVPLSTLWCFYPYTGENPFSDTFTTQPLLFFSIKVTPRVSLFRPSHYLLTNSFTNSGPMYTNSTANISNTFLITYYFFLPCYSKWKSHNVVWLSEVGVWKWGRHCRIFLFIFFPEVLISRSNEQAAVHGHQAIIFGYHANSEHDGMLLYWEIDPGPMTVVVKY